MRRLTLLAPLVPVGFTVLLVMITTWGKLAEPPPAVGVRSRAAMLGDCLGGGYAMHCIKNNLARGPNNAWLVQLDATVHTAVTLGWPPLCAVLGYRRRGRHGLLAGLALGCVGALLHTAGVFTAVLPFLWLPDLDGLPFFLPIPVPLAGLAVSGLALLVGWMRSRH